MFAQALQFGSLFFGFTLSISGPKVYYTLARYYAINLDFNICPGNCLLLAYWHILGDLVISELNIRYEWGIKCL